MMVSLFSVFDPVSLWGMPFNWISIWVLIFMAPWAMNMLGGRLELMFKGLLNMVTKMFEEISYPKGLGLVMMSLVLFIFISLNNSVGLFPFVFTSTSHVMITFSMGMLFWISFFIMGWISEFKNSSAHLVPEGAPMMLAPFMVMIESVSHLIRPVTLSVRLAANMMAGHLIIGLIASISLSTMGGFISSVIIQSVMLILEVAVAFIQAFVFSVLVLLYSLEYYK